MAFGRSEVTEVDGGGATVRLDRSRSGAGTEEVTGAGGREGSILSDVLEGIGGKVKGGTPVSIDGTRGAQIGHRY